MHPKAHSYLEPKGTDCSADGKQRENPEGTEDGGQEEPQPRPNAAMKGGVTLVQKQKQLCYRLLRQQGWVLLNFHRQSNIPMIFAV